MSTRLIFATGGLFALLLFAGCEAHGPGHADLPSIAPTEATLQLHHPEATGLLRDQGMGPQLRELLDAQSAFFSEVLAILHSTQTWQEAHYAMRTLLERDPEPRWAITTPALREQVVAGYMMQLESLRNSETPEALEAIESYTRLLIAHGSPEGSLVVAGLQALQTRVSTEEHRALASQARDNLRDRLLEKTDCEQCGLEQLRQRHPQLFTGSDAFPETRLAIAIDAIEEMLAES